MKKIYEKPDVEYVELTAKEEIANIIDGETDVKSADGWFN